MRHDPDVLVIGGGAVGLCSAYFLCRDGRQVVVIDQGLVGGPQACSYGNAGYIGPSGAMPLAEPGVVRQALRLLADPESPFWIRPRLSYDLVVWLVRFWRACNERQALAGFRVLSDLKRRSLRLFEEINAREGISYGFSAGGKLVVFNTERGFEGGARAARLFQAEGGRATILQPHEVRDVAPEVSPAIRGGVYYDEDCYLNPAEFVREMAGLVERAGGDVRSFAHPFHFEISAGRIRSVTTTLGTVRPREVVLAAGTWSAVVGRRLGLRLPLQSGKGYSITVRKPRNGPTIPIMLGEGKVAITPMGDRLRFAGILELSGLDLSISPRRLDGIRTTVRSYLPTLEQTETLEVWSGSRPCTPDGLPLIGRSPAHRNLTIACGHAMIGMGLAPITGKLVAQIIGEEPADVDLTPVRVGRY